MTHQDFNDFQEALLEEVVTIKDTKGVEYANSESCFANFERLSTQLGLSPPQVAWVYLSKHLDGIASYCRAEVEYSEPIRGRIVDAIVYLTLIAGMIQERKENKIKCKICGENKIYGALICISPSGQHDWI